MLLCCGRSYPSGVLERGCWGALQQPLNAHGHRHGRKLPVTPASLRIDVKRLVNHATCGCELVALPCPLHVAMAFSDHLTGLSATFVLLLRLKSAVSCSQQTCPVVSRHQAAAHPLMRAPERGGQGTRGQGKEPGLLHRHGHRRIRDFTAHERPAGHSSAACRRALRRRGPLSVLLAQHTRRQLGAT